MINRKKIGFLAIALFATLIFSSCNYGILNVNEVESAFEEAYFEGQKDAINGDVRIRKNNDSCYVWTKSCWNSGRQPTFNPSIICDIKK